MCKEYCGHGGHCGHDGHVGHIDHGGLGEHSGYGQDRTGQDRWLAAFAILAMFIYIEYCSVCQQK